MTSGRVLARNTLINLLGQGAPMLVALVSIPFLIRGLGTDRFGLLALAWNAIGYFSLFDLGLARGVTQLIAEKIGVGETDDIPPLIWTSLVLMGILGALGGGLLALCSPWLVGQVLHIPDALYAESVRAFYLISLSLPWVVTTAGLRGMLEAKQRFDLANMIRLPMGLITFLGPLAVLPFTKSVAAVIGVLLAGRVVSWAVHVYLCYRAIPEFRVVQVRRKAVRPLLAYGSWLTVSNVVSPLMDGVDRFIVGAVLTISAVAYYVTPYEMVTKLWVITAAVLGVLFPAFAASFARDPNTTSVLFDRGIRAVFVVVFPVALVLVTLADEGLTFWLGADFARHSAPALQWMAVGAFISMIGQVAFTLIQGVGRPDITGKLHLLELPIYLGMVYWLLTHFGVVGAAIAWTARIAIDTSALLFIAGRFLPTGAHIIRRTALLLVGAILVLASAPLVSGLPAKIVFLTLGCGAFGLAAWSRILTGNERLFILQLARGGTPPPLSVSSTTGGTG